MSRNLLLLQRIGYLVHIDGLVLLLKETSSTAQP